MFESNILNFFNNNYVPGTSFKNQSIWFWNSLASGLDFPLEEHSSQPLLFEEVFSSP